MGKGIVLEGISFRTANIGRATINVNVPVLDISINAPDIYTGMYLQLSVNYNPANTSNRGVEWSIVEGGEYATISQGGLITIDSSAEEQDIVVQAVSTYDSSLIAQKTIEVTYEHQSDYITSLSIVGDSTFTGKRYQFGVEFDPSDTYLTDVVWSIVSGSEYANINSKTGELTVKADVTAGAVTVKVESAYDSTIADTHAITVTYLDIIEFADDNMKQALLGAGIGSNGEITRAQAESVTQLPAFSGNTNIVSFDEFEQFVAVTKIKGNGFYNCTKLESIKLPASLTNLSNDSESSNGRFQGCTSLKTIDISNVTKLKTTVTYSSSKNFLGCSNLETIGGFNSGLTIIPDECFSGCSKLEIDELPPALTEIQKEAFKNCSKITSLAFPSTITTIGNKAFANSGLSSVDLSGCTSLTSIGGESFSSNNTTFVHLPSSITSIGGSAFYGNKNLTLIVDAVTPPTLGDNLVFSPIATSLNIYVPHEAVETYKAASGWSAKASYIKSINELNGN